MKRKPPKRRRKPGMRKLPKGADALYLFNIEVTFDDDFDPHGYEITDEIADAVNSYRVLCNERPQKAARELPAVIERLPQVPQLRNHLFVALKRMGKNDEAYAVNDQALKDHPDYIYAVMNKAIQHWEKDELDEVEKVLGGMPLTINRTFPKRKVFHASEVFAYFSFLIRFWVSKDNPEGAESHYALLEELLPEHPDLPELKKLIEINSLKGMMDEVMNFMIKSEERRKNRKLKARPVKPEKKPDPNQGNLFEK